MLQKLSIANEDERKSLLNQARPFVFAPDARTKFKRVLEERDFSIIFDCLLNTKDKTTATTSCDILSRVFEFVNTNLVIEKYNEKLQACLQSPNPAVKEVILSMLNRNIANSNSESKIFEHQK